MFDDVPRNEPSAKRMTLHLARYPTPPTIDDVGGLAKLLTGLDATADDLAEAKQILDESPSKDAMTSGADAKIGRAHV